MVNNLLKLFSDQKSFIFEYGKYILEKHINLRKTTNNYE